MKQMKKLMVMLMATMLLVVSCEAPGSLFKDTADTVNVVFQNLKARTTTVSSGSVDSVLIENVYFQYKAEHVSGITIGQTEGWTNLSERPGLGYTLKLGRGVWNIFLRGFATAEARTEAGMAETENTKAILNGKLDNFSVGNGSTVLAVTADVPLKFTNNTGKGSCTVNVTFDEAYAGVSKKATVRLQSGKFDQTVTLSFDETDTDASKAAVFTNVDNGIATITVDYLDDDGTPFGDAGTATTLIMTDMHTTTTATISMDVVKLTVNGSKPEGTVEDNVIWKVFNSVFDIYPDTVADNAIVVGYAENALGDQTPITYPYTIYTSATPDSQGRYKASDLGLVPITVTTSADLNTSGATEAWWGKTATVDYSETENTTLASVRLVDGVTSIASAAFWNCTGLTSITIPEGVTSIGTSAFSHCTGLTSITIPSSVTSIENGAFFSCTKLTSITIPASVKSIGSFAFSACTSLTSITIPASVKSIGSFAFSACTSLTSITIPEGVTSIGSYAFADSTRLTSITIPEGVTSIEDSTFSGCTGLTSITIPASVTSIGSSAFYSCVGLTNVTIPEGVKSIGEKAFYGCTGLTSITIPSSVTEIGGSAFENCNRLTNIYVNQPESPLFANASVSCTIHWNSTGPGSI
ncbi:leucine-rich repeat domain-containing protein [Bullifex porci]|nr:leucine-rich repeat domain-containing protein [Bullifex porci]